MKGVKQILIVEDNPADSFLLQEYLSGLSIEADKIVIAEKMKDVLDLSDNINPTLIFLDLNLPDSNGIETFLTIHKSFPESTIVVLSGQDDKEVALHAIQTGADDYLAKGEVEEKLLFKTISYSVERKKNLLKLKESEAMYRSLVENATEALVVYDVWARKFINVSKSATELFDYSEKELLDMGPEELCLGLQPDGSSSLRGGIRMIEETMEKKQLFCFWTFCNRQGKEIPCELRLVLLPSEKKLLIRGSIIDISERKKTQEALQASEKKYRALIEQATDAILVADPAGQLVLFNDSCTRLTGFSREELSAANFWHFYVKEDIEKNPFQISEVLNGKNVIIERRMQHKKGGIINIEVNASLMDNGCILAFIRDITDRKKAEEEVIKSNARFLTVSKATSDIVWDWDLILQLGWYNDNYYKILGVEKTTDDLVPKDKSYSRIHPDDRRRIKSSLESAVNSASEMWRDEYRYRGADGSYLHFLDRGYIIRDKEGKAIRMIGSMVDMTPVYTAQRKMAESESRLRTLMETNPECIKLLNADCSLVEINTGGLNMIEAETIEQVKGASLLPVVNDQYKTAAQELVAGSFQGIPGRLEFEMITLKGTHRWCEINMVPFKNADDEIIYALGVTRDITQRKVAEKELAASYNSIRELTGHLQNIREEERTDIAREIHDELGQQLSILKMDVSWVRKKIGPANEQVNQKLNELMEVLDDTVKSVRRISSALRPSLLDDLGLIAAIDWQLGEFQRRSGIVTEYTHPEEEIQLPEKTKTALFRIFQESLTNVSRHSKAAKVLVTIKEADDHLFLSVKDDGVGFDKDKISAKRTLGILGMKERTAMVDGTYEIKSTAGKGTVVSVKVAIPKTKTQLS